MVNLEELKEEDNRRVYKTPVIEIEFLTWNDIVTSSQYSAEGGEHDLNPGDVDDPGDDTIV